MKTRFKPRLPRMDVIMKRYETSHTGFELRGPRSKYSILVSIQNYQGLTFLPVTFTSLADLFPQLVSSNEQFC
jgi:hypothetical protein